MLRADGIEVRFGGVRAVDGVTLEVAEGARVGLVGPNGSGKSTFLNAVTGVVPAIGRLTLDGDELPLGRPGRVRRAGVARTFQTPQNFADLACIENVLLADADRALTGLMGAWFARPAMWRRERQRWHRAMAQLEQVGLAEHATSPASLLSYGQQRLLELARSLVGNPRVLLLDEPSAGLNAAETDHLAELLLEVNRLGISLLVVDHKIGFIGNVCDHVVVLDQGQVIATGAPAEVWQDERVMRAYLGDG